MLLSRPHNFNFYDCKNVTFILYGGNYPFPSKIYLGSPYISRRLKTFVLSLVITYKRSNIPCRGVEAEKSLKFVQNTN